MPESSQARQDLVEKYLRMKRSQKTASVDTIPKRNQEDSVPLSFGQQQIWLLSQLIPDIPAYNEYAIFHLPGQVDITVLERSLNEIIQRHEAWRTSFPMVNGQPMQKIHPILTLALPIVDLRHHPEDNRKTEALRLVAEDARIPFDLVNGPLLRATLMHLSDQEFWLCLAMHHIIFDGVAIYQVFLPELYALYEAFLAGRPSPLLPLPIQYADFAIWQREWLQGDAFKDQMTYWKRQLQDAPATLKLPTDRPRPSVKTYHGSRYVFSLSKHLLHTLKTLSGRENVTLYITLVAAFQTLLYRYTGQTDLLIGTVTGERKYPELQKLAGFFLNTLVLRTNLAGNPSFRELLIRVREVILEAQAHRDLPFEYLIKELQPERNLAQNPLIQVMLSFEPRQPNLGSGWNTVWWEAETNTAKFDLSLEFDERPEGLFGWFEYSTDLFDEATIARMVEHWQTLLESIVVNPEQLLSELPLLSQKERYQLLVEWNTTSTTYPREQCVHQLFEAQVERTPDAVALVFDEQQMTYQELNERANQLAHLLQKLGVGPEVLVGLCMARSFEMVVGLLGILKAGGAYVPLDPTYPKDRLVFMLQDTQAPVLLTQEQFIDLPLEQETCVICLDTKWRTITQECSENLVNGATAENLAYVMYTSGSTGRPKGVEVMHRNIVRLLFGVDYVRLDATQTLLHMAPISFDAATFELWGALLHGACCILLPERLPTPRSIGEAIRKHNITTAWLTASLFNAVIDDAPDALVRLRQLLTGGEALSVPHIRRALDLLPTTQLINGYGPTEGTTFTCCYAIPRHLSETTRSIPIGTPIGNTQVYILDSHLNLVPVGVPGELYIGGAGLARGYLNQPELTAERFVVSPFDVHSGARLYKTGDLVRYLPDGNIEFLGRLDHQVKIRGFRIELDEIEVVLGHHTVVREALVLIRDDGRNEKYIVAYVVPYRDQSATPDELRSFLKEQLPEYMIPSNFILLDFLPITPNGKTDRSALPAPNPLNSSAQETYVAPTSTMQQQLALIWEDLLGMRPIGIYDNFFYLGGHSLLAVRLVDQIERTFGKKIPLSTLFAGPTIEHLANALLQQEATNPSVPLIAVQASGSRSPFFYLHGDYTRGSFYCFTLARILGADQPFYALEPCKFDSANVPSTIEDIATVHNEALRTVQPKGPYLLGGFCNGALVAYEMARQLQAQGENVDLLVLVEPADVPILHKLVWKGINRIGKLMRVPREKQLEWFLRLRHVYQHMLHQRNLEDLKKLGVTDPSIQTLIPTADALRQDSIGMLHWLVTDYHCNSYSGKIILFQCSEEPFRGIWRRKAEREKDIEVVVIPGTHESCRTDYIQNFAEQLKLCFRKVQATELKG